MNLSETSEEPVRVPLFGTWRRAYLVVVGIFVVQVAAYYLLTVAAS